MMNSNNNSADVSQQRVIRHSGADRLFHWVMAATVLILLATSFLPILGMEFDWIEIHWITGLVLTVAILFHIVRALFAQPLKNMWFGTQDIRDVVATVKWLGRVQSVEPPKPGKYSPAQKLIHHVFTVIILAAIVTGLIMMVKIDTPLWERDPYWLEAATWGIVYVLHGLASLCLISLIMLHVYFGVRPEKLLYLRSMLRGWITRDEYQAHHDPSRWDDPQA